MRGVGLAAALREVGLDPVFLVSERSDLGSLLESYQLDVRMCEPTSEGISDACSRVRAQGLIVDSYRLSEEHFRLLGQADRLLVCFDDTAERYLDVDLVINGAPSAPSLEYRVGKSTILLLGTRFQIVRPDFTAPVTRDYQTPPRSLLVTVGGDDVLNVVEDLLDLFERLLAQRVIDLTIHFVIGPYFRRLPEPRDPRCVIHRAPRDMRRLMIQADLALSAGGQTLYELACCGTPTVAFCTGVDQLPNLSSLSERQAIRYAGWAKETEWLDRVVREISLLVDSAALRAAIGQQGRDLIDGGGGRRVADCIRQLLFASEVCP